ncbi:MAG: Nif3-like dinuclear metal center hexameric protein [Longimicrobiales bacterium]
MKLDALVAYLDEYLKTSDIPDYPHALNGLQVESTRPIGKIGVAVDASERALEAAVAAGCDLLIVHHGLFWSGLQPVVGRSYRKLKTCLDHGLAVYASHIPLDLHPEVGNSMVLARALGVDTQGDWGEYRGLKIGVWGSLSCSRDELTARMEQVLGGPVLLLPGGGTRIARLGVITGSAATYINEAIRLRLDAFVTGEGAHHTFFDATEGGLNVYFGGHYRTETWGVKALAQHIEQRLGIPWEFFDQPTGL